MMFWISAAVACLVMSEFSLSKYLEYHNNKPIISTNTVSVKTLNSYIKLHDDVIFHYFWELCLFVFGCILNFKLSSVCSIFTGLEEVYLNFAAGKIVSRVITQYLKDYVDLSLSYRIS